MCVGGGVGVFCMCCHFRGKMASVSLGLMPVSGVESESQQRCGIPATPTRYERVCKKVRESVAEVKRELHAWQRDITHGGTETTREASSPGNSASASSSFRASSSSPSSSGSLSPFSSSRDASSSPTSPSSSTAAHTASCAQTVCAGTCVKQTQTRRLVFRVLDTGEGIPSDKLQVIFQPFKQVCTLNLFINNKNIVYIH